MSYLKNLGKLLGLVKEAPAAEPKPIELKKRTKKLVARTEKVDLGVTTVKLKFEDGRELLTKVYGSATSSTNEGEDERVSKHGTTIYPAVEPSSTFNLFTSVTNAETYIKSVQNPPCVKGGFTDMSNVYIDYRLGSGHINYSVNPTILKEVTYVDDPRKPTTSFVGKVIEATIIRTESCLEDVTKYSVEDI